MAQISPFTCTAREASKIVSNQAEKTEMNENINYPMDNQGQHCFLLHLTFQPVYGEASIPQSSYKKLPRLVNGIPLGAGRMNQSQAKDIRWRYIEGSKNVHTFLSLPMTQVAAEESRRQLKDRLVMQAKQVFGEVTVKASVVLSQCLHYDEGIFLNDIAQNFEEGLHFSD